jgi:hypothetical protein
MTADTQVAPMAAPTGPAAPVGTVTGMGKGTCRTKDDE